MIKHGTDDQHAHIAGRSGRRACSPVIRAAATWRTRTRARGWRTAHSGGGARPCARGDGPRRQCCAHCSSHENNLCKRPHSQCSVQVPGAHARFRLLWACKAEQYLLRGCTGCCSGTQCVPPSTLGSPSFQRCARAARRSNTVRPQSVLRILLHRVVPAEPLSVSEVGGWLGRACWSSFAALPTSTSCRLLPCR